MSNANRICHRHPCLSRSLSAVVESLNNSFVSVSLSNAAVSVPAARLSTEEIRSVCAASAISVAVALVGSRWLLTNVLTSATLSATAAMAVASTVEVSVHSCVNRSEPSVTVAVLVKSTVSFVVAISAICAATASVSAVADEAASSLTKLSAVCEQAHLLVLALKLLRC